MTEYPGMSLVARRTIGDVTLTLFFGKYSQVYFIETKQPGTTNELLQVQPEDIDQWLPMFEEEGA